jgi:DNA invertase Pin-like site-specific DNA recombinase
MARTQSRELKVMDSYSRISREPDGTLRRVESQEEDNVDAINENPAWTVGKLFRDNALSAWNPKVVRPDFEALMTRLETGLADGVQVYDLTRFTRKPAEGERLLALAKRGVVVASTYSTYDLQTADGRKQFRDAMTAAAHESDKISERVRRGKRKKARRGLSNASHRGFAMPGYLPNPPDWTPDQPRIWVPEAQLTAEREAVREVARKLLAGVSRAEQVRFMNETELPTTYGFLWSETSLHTMLRRPSLAGIVTYDGEDVGRLSGEPVLDRETWDRVQTHFAAAKPGRKPSVRYLLTYLLFCGRCGHRLTGRPRVSRSPYADGEMAREYWCQKRAGYNSGCGRLNVDQRFADAQVTEAVLTRLSNPKHAARIARRASDTRAERARITKQLDDLNEDADAIADKVVAWGAARVDRSLSKVLAAAADLESRLAEIDGPESVGAARLDTVDDWEHADIDARRAMIKRAFPALTVMPATGRGTRARMTNRFAWDGPPDSA